MAQYVGKRFNVPVAGDEVVIVIGLSSIPLQELERGLARGLVLGLLVGERLDLLAERRDARAVGPHQAERAGAALGHRPGQVGHAGLGPFEITTRGRRRGGARMPGFASDRIAAGEIKAGLAARGVNISVSSHALLDFRARGITALARASVHCFNTEDEVDGVVAAVGDFQVAATLG